MRTYYLIGVLLSIFVSQSILANYAFNGTTQGQLDVSPRGAATYTIPIEVPPGVNGLQPNLSLLYNSQGRNGPLGVGWTLSGLSAIYRCPATLDQDGFKGGVKLEGTDRFCLDGKRLKVVGGNYGAAYSQYRTEADSVSRITAYDLISGNAGPEYFLIKTKDGKTIQYGWAGNSGVKQQGGTGSYISWNLAKITDASGNTIDFTYSSSATFNNQGYYPLERIDYNTKIAGVSTSVRFSYGVRSDVINNYTAGSKMFIPQRMVNVKTYVGEVLVRDYRLGYQYGSATQRSRITTITPCASDGCQQPISLAWQEKSKGYARATGYGFESFGGYFTVQEHDGGMRAVDINGDGLTDLITASWHTSDYNNGAYNRVYINTGGSGFYRNTAYETFEGYFTVEGHDGGMRAVDINGDGLTDLITASWHSSDYNNGAYRRVYLNTGSGFQRNTAYETFAGYFTVQGHDGGMRVVDIDADGLVDLITASWHSSDYNNGAYRRAYINTGSSFQRNTAYETFAGYFTVQEHDGGMRAVDINGDGLTDLITASWHSSDYNYGAYNRAYINTGSGFQRNTAYETFGGYFTVEGHDGGMRAADINGDGLTDLITASWHTSDYNNGAYNRAYINTHGKFSRDASYESFGGYFAVQGHDGGMRAADIDGDGLTDLITASWHSSDYNNGAYNRNYRANKESPDLLISVTDSLKSTSLLTYTPLTNKSFYTKYSAGNYPYQNIQNAMQVVRFVRSDNGVGGTNIMGYRYEGAKLHLRGRGFLGFARTVQTDHATGIVTTTNYYQKSNATDDYLLPPTSKDFWKTGMVYYRYQTHNGQYLSYDINYVTSRVSDAGVVIPYVYRNYQYIYDFGTAVSRKMTDILSGSVDAYGNVLRKVEGTYDYTTSKLYTQNTYKTFYPADTSNWLVSLVQDLTVTSAVASEIAGVPGDSKSQKVRYTYYSGTPRVWQEIREPDLPGTSSLRQVKTYEYNLYGNRSKVTVSGAGISPSRITRSDYNYSYASDRYQVTITNALNHVERRVYDWRSGNMLNLVGPNALSTTWQYDGFGRKRLESRADGTQSRWDYYCITYNCAAFNGEVFYATQTTSGQPKVSVYYDQLARKVRSEKTGFNNQLVEQRSRYDALGRLLGETNNTFQYSTPSWTCYQYDVLGRVTQQTLPTTVDCDSISSLITFKTMSYSRLQSTETVYNSGQNGAQIQMTRQWKNALGQLVKVQDAHNAIALYSYDALGKLTAVQDAAGNLMRTHYDNWGRKTAMDDPDMGHWDYDYNAADELVWQKDAKLQPVSMVYDALGRIKTRIEPDGSTTSWTYDSVAKGIGKLGHVQNNTSGYARSHQYDGFGRPSAVNTQVLFENYRTDTNYDAYGRVNTITYPTSVGGSRFQAQNCYDANGYLSEVRTPGACFSGGTVYWKANGVNANGQVSNETLGNGINTVRLYDTVYGHLTDISAGKGASTYQSSHFVYDRLGNLEERRFSSRLGVIQDVRETFGYDLLNRLTSANTNGPFGSINKSYGYDAIGNITTKSDFGNQYIYDRSPHAVSRVYNGNTLVAAYLYDANGNMSNGDGRTLSYTWFNKPQSVSMGSNYSTFGYDSEHMRVVQTSNQGTTVYVNPRIDTGGHYEKEIEGGVTSHKHYIYGANGVTAVHIRKDNGAANQTNYFLKDHLGSIEVITDQVGNQIERLSYDAFGKRRNINGSDAVGQIIAQTTHHGFTGHEHMDNVSLIHMNGRLYDPNLGKMLQPDFLVQNSINPQSLNRYSYSFNNPLGYYDPDGQFAIVAVVIGAIAGAYTGYKIAEAQGYDISDLETWGYMIGGAIIGGVSGGIGAEVAAAGGFMANTMGLMASSFINSVGMSVMSGGMMKPSISFGIGSYNFGTGEFNYLFDGDNEWQEDLGYFLGAMANVRDINSAFNSTNALLETDNSDLISHSAITDENGQILLSYGPDHAYDATWKPGLKGFAFEFRKSTSSYDVLKGFESVELTLNKYVMDAVARFGEALPYQGISINCVNMASLSLWANGIPNIGLHPYVLHFTTMAYSSGARVDLFSYYLTRDDI